MRILSMVFLALVLFGLSAANLQARITVVLQQRDGVVATITTDQKMITSDYVTFSLVGEKVVEKASQYQGQNVHILFYEAEDEKYCVDLRPAIEPAFEIESSEDRGN